MSSCPVRTELYGGLPSDGDFPRIREFGVGLANAFEAAHCLLGSLGRHLGENRDDWASMVQVEEGHLREELGIILDTLKEYSRPVYRKQMMDFSDYFPKYQEKIRASTQKEVDGILRAGPKLAVLAKSKAKQMLSAAKEHEAPAEWLNMVGAVYLFVIDLAEAAVEAVSSWPDAIGDPYSNPDVQKAARLMKTHLDTLLRWGKSGRKASISIKDLLEEARRKDRWVWVYIDKKSGTVYAEPPEDVEFIAKKVPPTELKRLLRESGQRRVASRWLLARNQQHYKVDKNCKMCKRFLRPLSEEDKQRQINDYGFYQYWVYEVVDIDDIQPEKVWKTEKLDAVLRDIDTGKALAPIEVNAPDRGRGKLQIRDGIHRYNASIIRGFKKIPVMRLVTVEV